MALSEPITDKECDISIREREGNWNDVSIVDNDPSVPTSSSLEVCTRKIKETSDLVFDLKLISPIPTRRNRTISAQNTILPRVFPMLDSIPTLTHNRIGDQTQKIKIKKDLNRRRNHYIQYQVRSNGSSRLFFTFITTFQFVVTLRMGPGNCPFIPITYTRSQKLEQITTTFTLLSNFTQGEKKEPVGECPEEKR